MSIGESERAEISLVQKPLSVTHIDFGGSAAPWPIFQRAWSILNAPRFEPRTRASHWRSLIEGEQKNRYVALNLYLQLRSFLLVWSCLPLTLRLLPPIARSNRLALTRGSSIVYQSHVAREIEVSGGWIRRVGMRTVQWVEKWECWPGLAGRGVEKGLVRVCGCAPPVSPSRSPSSLESLILLFTSLSFLPRASVLSSRFNHEAIRFNHEVIRLRFRPRETTCKHVNCIKTVEAFLL